MILLYFFFFFFIVSSTTAIYTLSLHDALPIYQQAGMRLRNEIYAVGDSRDVNESIEKFLGRKQSVQPFLDRKSTRLNSSHANISYAVFCLKKKNKRKRTLSKQREKRTNEARK